MNNWFSLPGAPGDRTFEQQMMGLGWLAEACRGKSVLDLGCADGLIDLHLLKHGAERVHGIELVGERVQRARKLTKGYRTYFAADDLNDPTAVPGGMFDVTLALAILHKLQDPSAVARRMAYATRELIVLRLPPATGSTIVDRRSGEVPHDIDAVLRKEGFVQERANNDGPFGEWIGVYRRPA